MVSSGNSTASFGGDASTIGSGNKGYDEEEIQANANQNDGENTGKVFDEEEYMAEVGEMNCYCVPSRVYGFKDFLFRTLAWIMLNKEQILGGFTVACTQIPEAISTALIAGVDPVYALQATWLMNIITSLIGGRPGMISGSTTFIGVSLIGLVEQEGVGYIFYAVMFAGFLQMNFGLLGMGALTRFIPFPVVQGFANAMALVIVGAQFRFGKVFTNEVYVQRNLVEAGFSWSHITDRGGEWNEAAEVGILGAHVGIAFLICLFLPRLTRAVPCAFVALFVCTFIEHVFIRTPSDLKSAIVADYAEIKIPTLKPIWVDNDIDLPPFNLETFKKIYLYGLAVFGAGICESLLTTHIVDDLTEVRGVKNRVAFAQGISNMFIASFGGMGGGASIGQSIVANYSDGITGLCTFLSGSFMVLFIYAAPNVVTIIPLGAIAGVMTWAAFKLVDWESILQAIAAIIPLRLRDRFNLDCKTPRADSLVMVSVMAFTVCLDLSIGLLSGVLVACFVYVWDSSTRVIVEREVNSEEATSVTYSVTGPLFFATASGFSDIFPMEEIQFDPDEVVILLEGAEVYDYSGMVAIKKVYDRFADLGKIVALSSLSPTSRRLMEKSAYMWQGVNFLEVEELDQSVDMTASLATK